MMRRLLTALGLAEAPGKDRDLLPPEVLREREERLLRPMPCGTGLILCRGSQCLARRKEMPEALRGGKALVVDLRGVDREEGQALLDYLSGVVETSRGRVLRLAPAVFLVVSHDSLVEDWNALGGGFRRDGTDECS